MTAKILQRQDSTISPAEGKGAEPIDLDALHAEAFLELERQDREDRRPRWRQYVRRLPDLLAVRARAARGGQR